MILMHETLLFIDSFSQTDFHRPVVESAEESDYSEFRDTAHFRAALHRPDVESAAEPDDPEFEMLLILKQLFTDLMQNEQQNEKPDTGDAASY